MANSMPCGPFHASKFYQILQIGLLIVEPHDLFRRPACPTPPAQLSQHHMRPIGFLPPLRTALTDAQSGRTAVGTACVDFTVVLRWFWVVSAHWAGGPSQGFKSFKILAPFCLQHPDTSVKKLYVRGWHHDQKSEGV